MDLEEIEGELSIAQDEIMGMQDDIEELKISLGMLELEIHRLKGEPVKVEVEL